MEFEKSPWYELALAALSAFSASYLFRLAGIEWGDISVWGYLVFAATFASLEKFYRAAIAIAVILVRPSTASRDQ